MSFKIVSEDQFVLDLLVPFRNGKADVRAKSFMRAFLNAAD